MTGSTTFDDCIVEDRGGIIENTHKIHAAIVDANGKLLFAVGNPSRVTLIRSAAKPAQALAILQTGAFERYDFDDVDLALMCASHSSEPRHIERALSILAKSGSSEADLRCGGHAAVSAAVNRAWIKADFEPTGVCNNCSGKHAGMLAGAQALGAPKEGHHLPEHPMQVQVRQTVEELCRPTGGPVTWACDGCNLPAPACSLQNMAHMYAQFAAAAEETNSHDAQTKNMARIFNAMSKYPEQVAGENRFCTILMEAFRGRLIGKVGADGCYGIGIRPSDDLRRLDIDGPVGIAVKVEDGSMDVLYAAVAELLSKLHIGDAATRSGLEIFRHTKRLNTAGAVVGSVAYPFQLRRL